MKIQLFLLTLLLVAFCLVHGAPVETKEEENEIVLIPVEIDMEVGGQPRKKASPFLIPSIIASIGVAASGMGNAAAGIVTAVKTG